jgi:hypothetical protein
MTGPYIIETRNDRATIQAALDATAAREARIKNPDPAVQVDPVVARRAVGTLEEDEVARALFNWRVGDEPTRQEVEILRAIEDGKERTPDGTTITVKPTTRQALLDDLGFYDRWRRSLSTEEICRHWNRAHGTETADAT